MRHKIKHYHIKNNWLISSVLHPFKLDIFTCYDTSDPTQDALHSIVKDIEERHAVIITRGIDIIETYEKWYGPETHGRVNKVHPIWQYVYSD